MNGLSATNARIVGAVMGCVLARTRASLFFLFFRVILLFMTFNQILADFRDNSFTERHKGARFERLVRSWLKSDPRYNNLSKVWLWEEFPARAEFGGADTGIDLVAKTETGEYWAVQCKCYKEDAVINKNDVDSFLATSSRNFEDESSARKVSFAQRMWISTTSHWGKNAEEAIQNQNPPFIRVGISDLENSAVDWQKIYDGMEGKDALRSDKKQLMEHQIRAVEEAEEYFKENERGKLIMACGTGKTFTALKIAEQMLGEKGLVLFLVPSISLLSQSLNAWYADSSMEIKAICICSDSRASRKAVKNEFDDALDSVVDLAVPATTNAKSIARQLKEYRAHEGLVVVFSTYQSIESVYAAQKETLSETGGEYGTFDLIVCDEAHRTTGVKLSDSDESSFTKIHKADYIKGRKRLYMTATPRLYGDNVKVKAFEKDAVLCSMDDEALYGSEIYRVNFSYAVERGLLTDYKVLVLTVNENELPKGVREEITNSKELNFDDTSKIIGMINGLSKIVQGDGGATWEADPAMMKRAIAFCSKIGDEETPGTSRNTAQMLPRICEKYKEGLEEKEKSRVVNVSSRHIDGSMNAQERNERLAWLAEDDLEENECRVLTNVRCLSEGIDVPALDAVLFLSSRNSQVDVVQSVGRVMRNFRRGEGDEKKYGYIIIPIVVPQNVKPEDALNDNKYFSNVWSILNALRSHDDHFNAEVNKISLNKNKSVKIIVGGGNGIGKSALGDRQTSHDAKVLDNAEVARELDLRFGELQQAIYAKLVEKCGDRLYWENWSKKVGLIAKKFIERIENLVRSVPELKEEFSVFVGGLQQNLNPFVDEGQVVEMLAQHLISQPVFDALFSDYNFVDNNTVSRSMRRMITLLEKSGGFEKDTAELEQFYDSVRVNVGNIDNLEGKQTIIKNLYQKFFKGAFPLTVEKLGIVYTPVECVDFIIHSVDDILRREFGTSLSGENVHILDPFVGTGTFITRLLQSDLIEKKDLERKYKSEIHCNEIVLLAYYIADVNIEAVYHEIAKPQTYQSFDGICLTDTFQLAETGEPVLSDEFFKENTEGVLKQKRAPIRVIMGNPPYSVGQKSANDNAQNLSYPALDGRIAQTYAAKSSANLGKSLYDSYIKAFRWASDRIAENAEGGIVAFISNGSWLDGNAQDGFRACLEGEFSDIYILNLRGNQRTSGELSRKEGGKIFGSGSRTPIAITFLVKNPAKMTEGGGIATIHYHDIGDYLTREQKFSLVTQFKSVQGGISWQEIAPNTRHDWINQRDGVFESLVPLAPEKKFDEKSESFFATYAIGLATNRDSWSYNFGRNEIRKNMRNMIDFYNEQRKFYQEKTKDIEKEKKPKVEDVVNGDFSKISWTRALRRYAETNLELSFDEKYFATSMYRPFCKLHLYNQTQLIESPGIWNQLFPTPQHENLVICVSFAKNPTIMISDKIVDLHYIGDAQCFPLYWYKAQKDEADLFSEGGQGGYVRHDGITDWILREVRSRYGGAKSITKEHIFYYVYGVLHSPQYRARFAFDLKKSLPRIPIAEKVEDFMAFCKAGKELAALHLHYEDVSPCKEVRVSGDKSAVYEIHEKLLAVAEPGANDAVIAMSDNDATIYGKSGLLRSARNDEAEYEFYAVQKMSFAKVRGADGKLVADKSRILYNSHITLENIPQKAYDYVVNGKSAVEWIMERYAVTVDKASQIKNDANDWAREHKKPRYILDLLLSVINLSVRTAEIVEGLPRIAGV